MEAIKHLTNDGWEDLYGYKMNYGDNLAGIDPAKALANLKTDERYVQKDVAKHGKDPASIHPSMISQDVFARFVSDRQIMFWNQKLGAPKSGTTNFMGCGETVEIRHGIVGSDGAPIAPFFCTYQLTENPMGCLGEVWCKWDAEKIIVGNTGSYTGPFTWVAFY